MSTLEEILAFEDIEVDEGDCGVIFKVDGRAFAFGDGDVEIALEDLYTKRSPEVLVMLISMLMSQHPRAEHCRSVLADLITEVMVISHTPGGVTH